jgi:hypothetical protein
MRGRKPESVCAIGLAAVRRARRRRSAVPAGPELPRRPTSAQNCAQSSISSFAHVSVALRQEQAKGAPDEGQQLIEADGRDVQQVWPAFRTCHDGNSRELDLDVLGQGQIKFACPPRPPTTNRSRGLPWPAVMLQHLPCIACEACSRLGCIAGAALISTGSCSVLCMSLGRCQRCLHLRPLVSVHKLKTQDDFPRRPYLMPVPLSYLLHSAVLL